MKKSGTKVLALILMLVMVFVLAACDGGGTTTTPPPDDNTPTAPPPQTEAPPPDEPPSDEAVTLTFAHFSTEEEVVSGNPGAVSFRYAIDQWETENPNVTLDKTVMANDEFKPWIATLAEANDLPDVFIMQGMNTKDWVSKGLVLPMDDIVNSCAWGSKYNTGLFAPFKDDNGALYAIPILAVGTCTIIAYDSELWSQAGYDTFPDNWDDVVAASAYFKGEGIDTMAFGNSGGWQLNSCWLSAVGDRFTGGDWFWSIINKTGAKFTDQAFIDSLKFTQDAFASGVFNKDVNSINNEEARELYLNGTAASFCGGNWDISHIGATADPELKARTKFAVIPQPAGASATTKTHAAGLGFGIAINSNLTGAKLEAAKNLATYVTGPVFADYLTANFAQIGCCASGDVDMSGFDQFTIDFYDFYENPTCEIYDSYMDGELVGIMNAAMQEMLGGTKTPEQVAQESQDAYK